MDIDGNYDIASYQTRVYVEGADLFLIGRSSKFNKKTNEELNKKLYQMENGGGGEEGGE